MVQTLEAIKGGGGSIKLGTTGTISALMSRELASAKSSPQTPVLSGNKSPSASVLVPVPSGSTTTKRPKPRTSTDEAHSSKIVNHKRPEIAQKARNYNRKTNQIPMLDSDNISIDGSPITEKTVKKGSCIVEIVDVRCGNLDRTWATPITNRIKKLGFSKLSQSIV